ncbi:MAG: glucose 1-dehydrogenase [Nitriliruptoraceae bacterium]
MGQLDGKVAIITGASRGIGAAAARRYGAEGASVAVNHYPSDDMTELAEQVVGEINDAGGAAIAVAADVSEPDQVDRMVATTREAFGDPDIMVTNAAAFRRGPWTEITPEQWDKVFAVNMRGTYLCARAVHEGMVRKGGGAIITVSSVMAHLGLPNMLEYVSTKGSIIAFTRALAHEVGKDYIRVNSVMPGAIRTEHEIEMGSTDLAASEARAAERQCLPRRGFAEDLAGTFVFLASEDSAFITGQTICVDGGWAHR